MNEKQTWDCKCFPCGLSKLRGAVIEWGNTPDPVTHCLELSVMPHSDLKLYLTGHWLVRYQVQILSSWIYLVIHWCCLSHKLGVFRLLNVKHFSKYIFIKQTGACATPTLQLSFGWTNPFGFSNMINMPFHVTFLLADQ